MTEEYEKFIRAISLSRFWKPFCFTLIDTKMNIAEALLLTWNDVSSLPLSNSLIEILSEYKNYREREQKLNRQSYIADDDLVFGNKNGAPRSASGISHVLKKYLKQFGLQNTPITLRSLKGNHLQSDNSANSKNKDFEM